MPGPVTFNYGYDHTPSCVGWQRLAASRPPGEEHVNDYGVAGMFLGSQGYKRGTLGSGSCDFQPAREVKVLYLSHSCNKQIHKETPKGGQIPKRAAGTDK